MPKQRVSWSARLREVLDDMHIVYAGIGAAAATVFCVLVLMSMMRFATRERPDSLAAIVSLLASPKVVEKVTRTRRARTRTRSSSMRGC